MENSQSHGNNNPCQTNNLNRQILQNNINKNLNSFTNDQMNIFNLFVEAFANTIRSNINNSQISISQNSISSQDNLNN